jgi:tetratricopeptide (TPR) repeat protein
LNDFSSTHADILRDALSKNLTSTAHIFSWLSAKIGTHERQGKTCEGLDLKLIQTLVGAFAENERMTSAPGRVAEIRHLEGRLYLLEGRLEDALSAFNASLDALPTPAKALNQSAGMPALQDRLLASQRYWEIEIESLTKALSH